MLIISGLIKKYCSYKKIKEIYKTRSISATPKETVFILYTLFYKMISFRFRQELN